MRIKNVSCTQFAGVRDSNVDLTDGINVIYGKNESGKSTLVNLISRTLFQNAKLDKRKNKDFYELYFPGFRKGSSVKGDFADGKVTFETDDGSYTLKKEWGDDYSCILSTPEGVVRNQKTVDNILHESLVYGEGVYTDLLLSSQKNTDISLQTILDASKKTDAKQEITDAVSQAFAESDGISMDVIEQAINKKIEELAGKHWDFERETPVRKAGGRWANGLGEILKAYYDLEDAKDKLEEISRLEESADHIAKEYVEIDAAVNSAEEAFDRFNTFASRLAVQSERKKAIFRIDKELQRIREVLENWPVYSNNLDKARALQAELSDSEVISKYEKAKAMADEINKMQAADLCGVCPEDSEIMQVKSAQSKVAKLKNKLCGMNLNAAINMLGDNNIEIISLRTGEPVSIINGAVSITEAVKIIVPGVMEMQLSPADVDVEYIGAKIAEQEETVDNIFKKYDVNTLEELEALVKNISESQKKIEVISDRLEMFLGNTTFEELESKAKSITEPVRNKMDVYNDIVEVCGNSDVDGFVTKRETIIEGYISEYGSINEVKVKAFDLENEMRRAKETVAVAEDVPEEYRGITDPESYREILQKDLKSKQKQREEVLTAKTAAASKLESCKNNASGDLANDVEKAKLKFEELKSLLNHWIHISEVFKAQKESINDNPMHDIAESFTNYLGIISNGKVSSEFPDADKLNMNIYSDNTLLDYGKLSEGTKETISLAFRLAVLDHLFPEGGGVIVLDDPLTDMDDERAAQSCELIKECADRHQVIFLTCREECANMLSDSLIQL